MKKADQQKANAIADKIAEAKSKVNKSKPSTSPVEKKSKPTKSRAAGQGKKKRKVVQKKKLKFRKGKATGATEQPNTFEPSLRERLKPKLRSKKAKSTALKSGSVSTGGLSTGTLRAASLL